jgi:hypothetical protein
MQSSRNNNPLLRTDFSRLISVYASLFSWRQTRTHCRREIGQLLGVPRPSALPNRGREPHPSHRCRPLTTRRRDRHPLWSDDNPSGREPIRNGTRHQAITAADTIRTYYYGSMMIALLGWPIWFLPFIDLPSSDSSHVSVQPGTRIKIRFLLSNSQVRGPSLMIPFEYRL